MKAMDSRKFELQRLQLQMFVKFAALSKYIKMFVRICASSNCASSKKVARIVNYTSIGKQLYSYRINEVKLGSRQWVFSCIFNKILWKLVMEVFIIISRGQAHNEPVLV